MFDICGPAWNCVLIEVSTEQMADPASDQVEYTMEEEEEENQDPQFAMSVCIKIVSP